MNSIRKEKKTIGFVPTMGALHPGHISLIEAARQEADFVVCSIFVNPTQFNDPGDLEKYPRTLETDTRMLEAAGCDLLFAPETAEIYSADEIEQKKQKIDDKSWKNGLKVDFGSLETVMEGAHRPGHFNGVAQVVSKLFRIVQPELAFFGQKDFQQLAIIRSMVRQLGMNTRIISRPTVREADGLAMSSRNVRLSAEERKKAPIIYQALGSLPGKANSHTADEMREHVKKVIAAEPMMSLEYIDIADRDTLQPLHGMISPGSAVACIAVKLGNVRLIDNILL